MEVLTPIIKQRALRQTAILRALGDQSITSRKCIFLLGDYLQYIEQTNADIKIAVDIFARGYVTLSRIGCVYSTVLRTTYPGADIHLWPLAVNCVMLTFRLTWSFDDEVRDGVPLVWGVNSRAEAVTFRKIYSRTYIPEEYQKQIINDCANMDTLGRAINSAIFKPHLPVSTNRVTNTYASIIFTRPWCNAPHKFDQFATMLSSSIDVTSIHDVIWGTSSLYVIQINEDN